MPAIDNLADDIAQTMRELLRRITALEKTTGLGNSAITNGAQVVKDSEGIVRARFGALRSLPGHFGVEILVGDRLVPLTVTAASGEPKTVPERVDLSARTNGNSSWTGTESVEVRTFTGKLEITMSGKLEVSGNKASIYYGYEIRDEPGNVIVPPNRDKAYACTYTGAGMGNFASSSRVMSETLPPGLYRVTGKHLLASGAGEESAGAITYRTLAVRAY